jgi:protein O-mannosyl-transferase
MMTQEIKEPSAQRRPGLGQLAALMLLSFLAWAPSLTTQSWSADDHEVILQSPVITGSTAATEAFKRDYTLHVGASGQWRPLSSLSLRTEYALFGPMSSTPWHLSNVLLHLIAVALAWLFARAQWRGGLFLGLLFFSLHPLLADSIAWVSGRPSMLCVALGLFGANLHAHALKKAKPQGLICLSAFIATGLPLLAKEDGLLFGLMLLGITSRAGRPAMLSSVIGASAAVTAWLCARALVLGDLASFAAQPVLSDLSLFERGFVGIRAAAEALRITVMPTSFPPRYELGALPSLGPSCAAAAAFAAIGVLCCRRYGWRPWLFICPALAFLPFMQIIPAGEVFAPRFAHIALLFAVPLADKALRSMPIQWSLLLFSALTLSTWKVIPHYESLESYWAATAAVTPESAAALNALGLVHQDRDDHKRALEFFERSIGADPSHSRAWSNKARSHYATGDLDSATTALMQAVKTGPTNPIAHVNWGRHLSRLDDHSGAKLAFGRAADLSPGLIHAWTGLAESCEALGELEESRAASERAQQLSPTKDSRP